MMYENSIEFYICYYGIWQTGAVVAPLNTYVHEEELQHIVTEFQPSCIVTSETHREKIEATQGTSNVYVYPEMNTKNASTDIDIPDRDPDAMAAVLYTSGTTGYPKGVMLSSRNIITNTIQGIALFDIQEHERVYAALPLFHSFMQNGCVWSPCMIGATTIIIPRISRAHIKKGFEHKPTFLPTIPQLYGLLCRLRGISLSSVKLCLSGGDALADKIRMACALRFRRNICNGYGLTETSPFISVDLDDTAKPTNSIGYPIPGIEVDIRDSDNVTCSYAHVGTLWVRGDNVMIGYYNAPEQTASVLKNGWFNTGDLALQTPEGKLMLCGREKDLIIHKGRNIYPQEIENVLMTHPQVTMAGVIGKKKNNEEWPVAFVAVGSHDDAEAIAREVRTMCHDHLASYKIPIEFHVRKSLPATTTGKVDKKALRAEL